MACRINISFFYLLVISSLCMGSNAEAQTPAGQIPATQSSVGKPNSRQIAAEYTKNLQTSDPAIVADTVSQIRAALNKNGKFGRPVDEVGLSLTPLLEAKQYAAADEFAATMINNTPFSINRLEEYLTVRVKSHIAMGKPTEAIVFAKSLYNVCKMKDTNVVIDLICDCLYEQNQRTDAGIDAGRKFKLEQIRGAAVATTDPSTATTLKPNDEPFLHSIHIDASIYDDSIAYARKQNDFNWMVGLGNLLLMSDRPSDAEDLFRKACMRAANKDELTTATEGVGRSLRAMDGTVGRANAWIVSFMNRPAADQNQPPTP